MWLSSLPQQGLLPAGGADEDAIRKHHKALGVPCGDVHQVDGFSKVVFKVPAPVPPGACPVTPVTAEPGFAAAHAHAPAPALPSPRVESLASALSSYKRRTGKNRPLTAAPRLRCGPTR